MCWVLMIEIIAATLPCEINLPLFNFQVTLRIFKKVLLSLTQGYDYLLYSKDECDNHPVTIIQNYAKRKLVKT